MIVVIPKTITDGMVVSTTAPNSPYDEWTAMSYPESTTVLYMADNSIYTSAAAVISTDVPGDSEKWVFQGKNNPYRLFDGKVNSPTVAEDGFTTTVEITGTIVDSLAGFGIFGVTQINLSVDSEGYYREIFMQDNSGVLDWWTYYFSPIIYKTSFIVYDLPATLVAEIEMEFVSTSTASVGEIKIGPRRTIGTAIDGSGFDNDDLSRVDYDDFGNVTGKTIRPNIDVINYDVKVDSDKIQYLRNTLREIGKTTECVWSGSANENDDLLAYGFYTGFSSIIYSGTSDVSITVRTSV